MNVALFGSSTLDLPFAFPSGDVADMMGTSGVSTSSARASALTVIYWDGVDANAIKPLTPGVSSSAMAARRAALSYLSSHGASKEEASAYIAAMVTLPDASWLLPAWSYFKTILQETTGTGAQGSSGSGGTAGSILGKIPWGTLALFGIGGLALYGFASGAGKGLLSK